MPAMVGSRNTATRFTSGEISLSSSSHLALRPYSNMEKPVALPPGRARLATKPAPTGSMTPTKAIGTVRLRRCSTTTIGAVAAKTTSGVNASKSAASLRMRSGSRLLAPQRYATRTLRPTDQPSSCNPCRNAALRLCPSASSEARFMKIAMRRMRSGCCARAASGHVTAAPPRSVMNSRRFIVIPLVRGLGPYHTVADNTALCSKIGADVVDGSNHIRWTHSRRARNVRFTSSSVDLWRRSEASRIHAPQQTGHNVYSITPSASARTIGAMVMPSTWAVLRLITSSYFAGC